MKEEKGGRKKKRRNGDFCDDLHRGGESERGKKRVTYHHFLNPEGSKRSRFFTPFRCNCGGEKGGGRGEKK